GEALEAELALDEEAAEEAPPKKTRTRVISLDASAQAPAVAPAAAAPAVEAPAEAAAESTVAPIDRTAAELAEEASDEPTEITVLKPKRRPAAAKPPPGPKE